MRKCVLCKIYVENTISFRVPQNEEKRKKWVEICGLNLKSSARVCIKHFAPGDIINAGRRVFLLPRAVPIMETTADNGKIPQNYEEEVYRETPLDAKTASFLRDWCFPTEPAPQLSSACPSPHLMSESFLMEELSTSDTPLLKELTNKDGNTQTDPSFIDLELDKYRKRITALEIENKDLKLKLSQAELAINRLKNIFTDVQLRKLMAPGDIRWKWEDISSAICLHAAGPRAYNHLYQKGFPLPHYSTLQRWCQKVDLKEGILNASIDFMHQATDMTAEEKITVLSFDEMKVVETYEYDAVGDVVRKPANYVQVVMAQGLKKSWKQPVFYDFDRSMTKYLLNSIITKLNSAGFIVVAVVCDMGPSNRKLWKELGVTTDKPWFTNPSIPRRQKVKLAAQLFSHSTASAIKRCYSLGMDIYRPLKTSTFIELVNNWFDVFNSTMDTFAYPGKEPYGLALVNQKNTLSQMAKIMSKPIIPGKKTLEHFQNGILMSITALYMLHEDVGKYNMTYILTNRLNQDVLEHFFGAIRSKGGWNDHPSPQDFKYRLRKYILARNTEMLNGKGTVDKDNTEWLNSADSPVVKGNLQSSDPQMESEDILMESQDLGFEELPSTSKESQDLGFEYLPSTNTDENISDLDVMNLDDIGVLQEDALEYVAGYIIRKQNLVEYECLENSYTWVDQVSKGFLKKPSNRFLLKLKQLENIFYKINGSEISHSRNLHRHLVEQSEAVDLPLDVKKLFYKCRINFRIRDLNKRLKNLKAKQRIMGFKKMIKIKL